MGLIQITGEVSRARQPRSRLLNQPHVTECPAKSLSTVLIIGFEPTELIKTILEATHAD
jgi:hypothetical protein